MNDIEKISVKINQAKDLLRENRLLEAKKICLNIYNNHNKNYEIINLLGIIELNLENYEISLKYFNEAMNLNSSDEKIYNNLGILNYKIGKIDNAVNYFKKAIEIDKNSINPYKNLGKIKLSQNDYKEAKINFEKVLKIDEKNLEALLSLSDILFAEKKYLEAKKKLYKIIELKPNFFKAYNNLGNIEMELNENENALKNLIKSNEIKENKAAFNNIGLIYKKKKNFDLAITYFNKALNLDSNYLESLYNLGIVHTEINKFENAIEYFKSILEIDKNYPRVLGKIIHCERLICKWDNHEKKIEKLKENILKNKNCITPWEAISVFDSQEVQLKTAETWIKNNFIEQKVSKNLNLNNKKIKIGYFSSDFFKSAVATQIVEMIELHNKEKFDVIGFSLINKEDGMQERLKKAFSKFINIENKSSDEVVELCNSINLDIAIDLTGFTLNNRFEIFEKRCAPIQISYLGYSATTGSKNMDYIVADKIVIPEESQKYFSEKIIYLPNTFMVNDNKKEISKSIISKNNLNIPTNSFLLGCFNQHYKISPEIFDIWIKILLKNNSCFILLNEGNELSKDNLLKIASKKGLNKNKIIFLKRLNKLSDHLNRLKLVDLFIDTFPYCSHTTACDVLFIDKPLVSLKGNSFASRISSSLLYSLNLEELITNSLEDYESKINDLIKNKSKLKEINLKIINNKKKSLLFNTKIFVQNLEKAYMKVYENFINNKDISNVYIN